MLIGGCSGLTERSLPTNRSSAGSLLRHLLQLFMKQGKTLVLIDLHCIFWYNTKVANAFDVAYLRLSALTQEVSMKQVDDALSRFIRSFEHNSSSGNASEAGKQFAEQFLVVSPHGAQCVRSVDFAAALPKRKELFDGLGRQSSELIGLKEVRLDQRYVLARTRWRFIFEAPGEKQEAVEVESTFMIDTGVEPFQIIVYLAHQDIMEILKQRGFMISA